MDGESYIHYNHTDHCNNSRWTARESFEYMHSRPWQKVMDFYSVLVRDGGGSSSLSSLFPVEKHKSQQIHQMFCGCEEGKLVSPPAKEKTGKWERKTYEMVLSYHGGTFDGWQKQPCLNTVQHLVEKSLGSFVDERKAQQLRERSLPVEACVIVAGRTDKGVTALQQVCSFYTWRKDVKSEEIKEAINLVAPEKLRALLVSEVSRVFHPNFSAKWRRYFYIFSLDEQDKINGSSDGRDVEQDKTNDSSDGHGDEQLKGHSEYDLNEGCLMELNGDEHDKTNNPGTKPRSFIVSKVNRLIRQLEGKSLSYKMFARDTKASRSSGPPTECFMFHARAAETQLPSADQDRSGLRVMCVELVANRFLRKMVRVLIATAIREAAAGADDDGLIKLMDATCRRATAPPAPPEGLCLVDVGYGEFDRENCLIL